MDLLTKRAPELPEGYTWFNTTEQLSLSKLKGHIIILDFWTYCCINCMHMLPVLARLEEAYKDKPVVIIGVHSAKFKNEQDPENIRKAIERYEITHPVVVDEKMHIWHEYFATAWPTTVIIGADGKIAFKLAGEYNLGQMTQLIDDALNNAQQAGNLAKKRIRIKVPKKSKPKSKLSFPGKMSFSSDSKSFALSDSNNNRILIINTSSGKILTSIGNGKRDLKDGKYAQASFYRPQGVLWLKDKIYVADTENHALREIDLKKKSVRTIAGKGQKGEYVNYDSKYPAANTRLNSPWDIASDGKVIYVAMAGLHQIWVYDIKDMSISVFAGRGSENITEGPLRQAEFAQPSGLWLDGDEIYVADSEVSAVRSISLAEKYVSTLIGAGLFTFGDSSGAISSAMLQHPLGVSSDGSSIYVADTYNSSIKSIDIEKGRVMNVVGSKAGKSFCRFDDPNCDTLGLYEPSDVKVLGDTLFIVDTNNHLIRTFSMKEKILKTLDIK